MKVQSSTIENKYLRIKSINIGACLYEVYDKKKKINLILNLGSKQNYRYKHPSVGSTCGRYAGRISNAKFKIGNKKFNLNYVYNFFKGKNKDIKNFLLDQKFVSGIGNIYASEILFFSKVNPFKKVKLLSKKECQKIIINSRKILLKAISKGGSSIRDFKDTSGSKGGFQNEFKVYQQEGLRCKNRGFSDFIRKKIISNRSTFFCDSCQK